MSISSKICAAPNMIEALRIACEMHGDAICQIFKDDSREPGEYRHKRTFREYFKRVEDTACGLMEEGVSQGDMVCILSENRPDWSIIDHAILMNNCVSVGIYTNDSKEHIKFKINDTNSTTIVVEDKKQLNKVLSIPQGDVPSLKKIIVFDTKGANLEDSRIVSFEDIFKKGLSATDATRSELKKRTDGLSRASIARLVYTSGTSGNPKGVMLTHNNLLSNAEAGGAQVEMMDNDILVSYLPEAHSFQTLLSFASILIGASLGYSYRKTLMSDLPQLRPTVFPGVQKVWAKVHSGVEFKTNKGVPKVLKTIAPRFLGKMLMKKGGLDRVRAFVSGAGKLEPYTYTFFKNFFGVEILLGYGLSETSPVISFNMIGKYWVGSSGKPIPGVEAKIVDAERKPIPVGETGEIAVRGQNVFVGYLNNEDKYHDVVDRDGWFFTGDRGYLDKDGYIYVLGRAGHRVKFSDGEHHDLEEIGSRILGYTKYITQIAVYGEGKDFPVAIVTLSDEDDDLRRMANELGVEYKNRDEFAYNKKVVEAVRKDFELAADSVREKEKIQQAEDVKKALYIRPMSEDNGEKTPTQKTRLNLILLKYEPEILKLYESKDDFAVYVSKD